MVPRKETIEIKFSIDNVKTSGGRNAKKGERLKGVQWCGFSSLKLQADDS